MKWRGAIRRFIVSIWIRRFPLPSRFAPRSSMGTPITARIAISRLPIGTKRSRTLPFPRCHPSMNGFPSFIPWVDRGMRASEDLSPRSEKPEVSARIARRSLWRRDTPGLRSFAARRTHEAKAALRSARLPCSEALQIEVS